MPNALVPELGVSDWRRSRRFYCDVLGFLALYERPEEGFSYLALGAAELMIDQIGLGRSFDTPREHPFGRGLNLQIRVPAIRGLLDALAAAGLPLFLPAEERWYRKGARKSASGSSSSPIPTATCCASASPSVNVRQSFTSHVVDL